jgi:hypothetical protein
VADGSTASFGWFSGWSPGTLPAGRRTRQSAHIQPVSVRYATIRTSTFGGSRLGRRDIDSAFTAVRAVVGPNPALDLHSQAAGHPHRRPDRRRATTRRRPLLLTLAERPVLLPPTLADLLIRLREHARPTSTLGRCVTAPTWLFPGGHPGHHRNGARFTTTLAGHGIDVRPARTAALTALAEQLPRATGNGEVRSGSGGPGGCIARRRRKAPWSWAPTDGNAARCRPVVASRTAPLPVAPRAGNQRAGLATIAVVDSLTRVETEPGSCSSPDRPWSIRRVGRGRRVGRQGLRRRAATAKRPLLPAQAEGSAFGSDRRPCLSWARRSCSPCHAKPGGVLVVVAPRPNVTPQAAGAIQGGRHGVLAAGQRMSSLRTATTAAASSAAAIPVRTRIAVAEGPSASWLSPIAQ